MKNISSLIKFGYTRHFIRKTYDDGMELSPDEKRTYDMIKVDNWAVTTRFKGATKKSGE
jgi:hypothetical protein